MTAAAGNSLTASHVQLLAGQPALHAYLCIRELVIVTFLLDHPGVSAGGVEQYSITLEPCQQYVDEWLVVDEQEIKDAMVSLLNHHSKLVEGAAGCGIAALKKLSGRLSGKRVVVVCCGGNVAVPVLQKVLAEGMAY